jgi:hypothetical protein
MQSLLRRAGILLAIGFAFGWLGPFGTYDSLALGSRLAFWMVSVFVIGLLAEPTGDAIGRALPSWPAPVRALAGAVMSPSRARW